MTALAPTGSSGLAPTVGVPLSARLAHSSTIVGSASHPSLGAATSGRGGSGSYPVATAGQVSGGMGSARCPLTHVPGPYLPQRLSSGSPSSSPAVPAGTSSFCRSAQQTQVQQSPQPVRLSAPRIVPPQHTVDLPSNARVREPSGSPRAQAPVFEVFPNPRCQRECRGAPPVVPVPPWAYKAAAEWPQPPKAPHAHSEPWHRAP